MMFAADLRGNHAGAQVQFAAELKCDQAKTPC